MPLRNRYKLDRAQLADKLHAIRISLHDLYRLRQVRAFVWKLLCSGFAAQKFDRHDVEGSGRIRVSQLKNLLADLGEKVTAKKIEKACAELDKRKLGKVEFYNFVGCLLFVLSGTPTFSGTLVCIANGG